MKEPARGSVVLTDGPTGTAWQRHNSDGLWHSTAPRAAPKKWVDLVNAWPDREPILLYEAPSRDHDDHEIHYSEKNLTRTFGARIDAQGNVRIDESDYEIDFTEGTQTEVWCATCQRALTPDNSPLADDWEVV